MKQLKQILNLFNIQNQHLSPSNITAPIITMIGTSSLLIENVYTLIEYEKNMIILKSDDYFITINGDNLSISFMYPNEMKLTGEINHIGFNN
ncbi:MAG TPA: YabP/YqfC family sporulation protein [Pseudogracilibacillus sp.]|nr:YabP/YqfC family sporulation protein [Pseudogracilibacillus sp.]